MPLTNIALPSYNCNILTFSSCNSATHHPTNLLHPQPTLLWETSQQLPQFIIISLEQLRVQIKSINEVGFMLWHDYETNPKKVQLWVAESRENQFIYWEKFLLKQKKGVQMFKIKKLSKKYVYLKMTIIETYGNVNDRSNSVNNNNMNMNSDIEKTYLNQIFIMANLQGNNVLKSKQTNLINNKLKQHDNNKQAKQLNLKDLQDNLDNLIALQKRVSRSKQKNKKSMIINNSHKYNSINIFPNNISQSQLSSSHINKRSSIYYHQQQYFSQSHNNNTHSDYNLNNPTQQNSQQNSQQNQQNQQNQQQHNKQQQLSDYPVLDDELNNQLGGEESSNQFYVKNSKIGEDRIQESNLGVNDYQNEDNNYNYNQKSENNVMVTRSIGQQSYIQQSHNGQVIKSKQSMLKKSTHMLKRSGNNLKRSSNILKKSSNNLRRSKQFIDNNNNDIQLNRLKHTIVAYSQQLEQNSQKHSLQSQNSQQLQQNLNKNSNNLPLVIESHLLKIQQNMQQIQRKVDILDLRVIHSHQNIQRQIVEKVEGKIQEILQKKIQQMLINKKYGGSYSNNNNLDDQDGKIKKNQDGKIKKRLIKQFDLLNNYGNNYKDNQNKNKSKSKSTKNLPKQFNNPFPFHQNIYSQSLHTQNQYYSTQYNMNPDQNNQIKKTTTTLNTKRHIKHNYPEYPTQQYQNNLMTQPMIKLNRPKTSKSYKTLTTREMVHQQKEKNRKDRITYEKNMNKINNIQPNHQKITELLNKLNEKLKERQIKLYKIQQKQKQKNNSNNNNKLKKMRDMKSNNNNHYNTHKIKQEIKHIKGIKDHHNRNTSINDVYGY